MEQTIQPTEQVQNSSPKRVWEIDALRGILVLLMIIDHMLYDATFIFDLGWFSDFASSIIISQTRFDLQTIFGGMFVFLCGVSSVFSRSNFKRGFKVLVYALALTGVTAIAEQATKSRGMLIVFGVLHMLAVSMLVGSLFDLVKRLIAKINKPYDIVAKTAFDLVLLTAAVIVMVVGFKYLNEPANEYNFIKAFFVYHSGFVSADYFALFPWIGFYTVGYVFAGYAYANKKSLLPKWECSITKPLQFVGGKAFIFYFAHQAFFFALFSLLENKAG